MVKKRPCRICGCWFLPDMRAGSRQQVCSKPDCQRERHRRNCADWHDRERIAEFEARVEKRIVAPAVEHPGPLDGTQSGKVNGLVWSAMRDLVGAEVCAVIRVLLEHLRDQSRDAVRREALVLHKEFAKHLPVPPRDAIARPPPGG